MKRTPVIAIFDAGKTNKKVLLFDEQYQVVLEENSQLEETQDDDGFPCEDITALTQWVKDSFQRLVSDERFDVKAVNFSAYGASFVYLDEALHVIPPLYNYLKPYPPALKKKFYDEYGSESRIARETASPVLGNLNSGMQLYRLKYEKPVVFGRIKYALHLPQYLSFILSSAIGTDITSIGCHTSLWDFQHNRYHRWVRDEGIDEKFPEIMQCREIAGYANASIPVGFGLHDSSAALIPYLASFTEPFILLSTGTWCISLNPFNHDALTDDELNQDCLCYLSYEGRPVKASRLFAGYEHEQQARRLASHFSKPFDYFTTLRYDDSLAGKLKPAPVRSLNVDYKVIMGESVFAERNLEDFPNYDEAYQQLVADIISQQVRSTKLVLSGNDAKRIFVDGGFSQNEIYMNLLAGTFPGMEVYAASVAQSSALGAALAIHQHWNSNKLPADLVELKLYAVSQDTAK